MATRNRPAANRTSRTSRTTIRTTRSTGGGAARWLLPAAALGGLALYLLWPRTARAATQPQIAPPGPSQLPPPPLPAGVQTEPVVDAPLSGGERRGRIRNNEVRLRSAPNENAQNTLALLNRGTGVAVPIGPPAPPTPAAPQGWQSVRTAGGRSGFVAAQFVEIEGQPQTIAQFGQPNFFAAPQQAAPFAPPTGLVAGFYNPNASGSSRGYPYY